MALKISIGMNLCLFGSVIFLLVNPRKGGIALTTPRLSKPEPASQPTATPARSTSSDQTPETFRWDQLVSAGDYRVYIANLRAIGCPEPTIEDIVRGDAARAFSWERKELRLDGSGDGPWSRPQEMQLVASLLGAHPPAGTTAVAQTAGNEVGRDNGSGEVAESAAPVQAVNRRRGGGIGVVAEASMPFSSAGAESPSYPLFLQNPDWSALGFTAEQQAAIAQVRQQFQNEISGLNQNPGNAVDQNGVATGAGGSPPAPDPGDPGALTQWQKALQNADEQLQGLLGAQAYMGYEQQQYYAWYQPQVAAAAASGEQLTINPAAFH
ncbi:MAG TPA: hypothetical protein VMA35_14165 [Candidatus Sulfopaludibacter sp.]|nr:hypothetical protein [Candidatus Sulfopaludibacter sp.]